MITEHSTVVLVHDLPDAGLTAGDVGAVVFVHHEGKAYEVEFVDGDGTTVALVTLNSDEVRSLVSGELLHARKRG
jgi:uncharacterized protein DUF4926